MSLQPFCTGKFLPGISECLRSALMTVAHVWATKSGRSA